MAFYTTRDEAARAALLEANPLSIRHNREYRGFIYQIPDGRFGYTFPMMGDTYSTSLDDIHIPPDSKVAGEYHTHGDYTGPGSAPNSSVRTNRANSWRGADIWGNVGPAADIFGPEDIPGARRRGRGMGGYRSYLGTPSGIYYYYDVDTDTMGRL